MGQTPRVIMRITPETVMILGELTASTQARKEEFFRLKKYSADRCNGVSLFRGDMTRPHSFRGVR